AQRPVGVDKPLARDDAGQGDDGARREIDAAGDDHHRGADRGDAVDRRVFQDQQRVRGVEERVRARSLGPQIPGEEDDLEDQNRDGAELSTLPQLPQAAAPAPVAASRITDSSSVSAADTSPRTRPSRMMTIRSASARISGKSLETTRHAAPPAAASRIS